MNSFVWGILFALALPAAAQEFPESVYAPLWNYNGTWSINIAGQKPDTLVNHCARTGVFFACEQQVNGKTMALVAFTPIDANGHYRTSPIQTDGTSSGSGELEIKGNHWTYLGHGEESGKTVYYQTTNEFTGDDHIHFESATSADKVTWKIQRSGDEVRTAKGVR